MSSCVAARVAGRRLSLPRNLVDTRYENLADGIVEARPRTDWQSFGVFVGSLSEPAPSSKGSRFIRFFEDTRTAYVHQFFGERWERSSGNGRQACRSTRVSARMEPTLLLAPHPSYRRDKQRAVPCSNALGSKPIERAATQMSAGTTVLRDGAADPADATVRVSGMIRH